MPSTDPFAWDTPDIVYKKTINSLEHVMDKGKNLGIEIVALSLALADKDPDLYSAFKKALKDVVSAFQKASTPPPVINESPGLLRRLRDAFLGTAAPTKPGSLSEFTVGRYVEDNQQHVPMFVDLLTGVIDSPPLDIGRYLRESPSICAIQR